MLPRFFALRANDTLVANLSALQPDNPFALPAYFKAMECVGHVPWVLGIGVDAKPVCGCGAFLLSGKINKELHIVSVPRLESGCGFWEGLLEFCRQLKISSLTISSFNSPSGVQIPVLSSRGEVKGRYEYVLDLSRDLEAAMSAGRRRDVRKAIKDGLGFRCTRLIADLAVHHSLMNASMERRQKRGESVYHGSGCSMETALLEHGAGELFQATHGAEVVSSVLIVRSSEGSYCRSAGSSPAGMKVNASSFLNFKVACELKVKGVKYYNFGGASDGTTLAQFKRSFGAQRIPLVAATFYLGPSWKRYLTSGIHFLRLGGTILKRRLVSDNTGTNLSACSQL